MRVLWLAGSLSALLVASSCSRTGSDPPARSVPPNQPTNHSPAHQATEVPANPSLCVQVSDPEGHALDVKFHGREVTHHRTPEFTIIALPDTQKYSQNAPHIFAGQAQWIVDNLKSRNIVFVTHLGDCVEVASENQEWADADAAFQLIEDPMTTMLPDGIPYGISIGNHDQSPVGKPRTGSDEGATTVNYNSWFGVSRFQGRSYYGGHYGTNNDNHYELFSGAGMDFLIVHLEYDPKPSAARAAVLRWADDLLSAYGDRRAIVTCHHILLPDASFSDHGQAIWDALKRNHNLFLMLGGHMDEAARRTEIFTDASGTTRVQALPSDYQTLPPYGGNGNLRILTFSPDENAVTVRTFSPWLNQYRTSDKDQFVFSYDMQGGLPFQVTGSATGVASGGTACAEWPGREPGKEYEWYVTVSDGTSTVTGPTFRFTSKGRPRRSR